MEKEMSKLIEIAKGVNIAVEGRTVTVKGPKGELKRDFDNPKYNRGITLESKGDSVEIKCESGKEFRAVAGTIAAHIKNMMLGVTDGFQYKMKVLFAHFPVTVTVKDNEVHIKNFLGEKGARIARIAEGCSVKVEKEDITLTGADIEAIGQTAQRIEQVCRLTGRDRRIFQDGVYITGKFTQKGAKI